MFISGKSRRLNRKAAFAGRFYPGTENALRKQLADLFSKAQQTRGPLRPQAIIAPHAGYVFSGRVAASAFNQIPANTAYQRVFVLASSHQYSFSGAAIFDSGNYETPLGEIKTDVGLATDLLNLGDIFRRYPEAHEFEHSLEVLLPFIQYRLKDHFLLVPIILGTNNPADCEKIAQVLQPYFKTENLFVISTDFSHYPDYSFAVDNDLRTADTICSNDPEKLLKLIKENKKEKVENLVTFLCGWTSVLTLLHITSGKPFNFQKVEYLNSGDSELYGEMSRVVGYWALAVYPEESVFRLSASEQQDLLEKARLSITGFLKNGNLSRPESCLQKGMPEKKAGVFVSVYVENKLRGCIGSFAQNDTLSNLVQQMAVSAACDCRFENLHPDELDQMELEISVLSELKKISSIKEIELGKHGIYIRKGMNSGTFLPQVAQKTGWNLEEFLGHCSRDKARLGWDGWKNAELFTYEAFIFRG